MTEQARRVLGAWRWNDYGTMVGGAGGSGRIYAFGPEVRTTDRLETIWDAATHLLNIILAIRNDGPGWRADIRKNDYREQETLFTGWSDGGFSYTGEQMWKPTQMEALLEVLEQALIAEGWTVGETP